MADNYYIPGYSDVRTTLPVVNVDATSYSNNPYPPEFDAPAYSPTSPSYNQTSYPGGEIAPQFDAPEYSPTGSMPASTPYQYMDLPINSSSSVGNWLQNLYSSMMGPGTALGGKSGAFTGGASGGMGAGGQGWLSPLMSIGSGIYGMSQAEKQRQEAQRAIAGSSPWTSSGGQAAAGTELTRVMQGDFTNDPGFKAAQLAASRTSSQQPGGFAAQAAAQAALKYQNDRIQALSQPAGVGFSPGAGYQTAMGGMTSANELASRSLGSIGYGVTGTQPMPPWLQQYLITNGMGNR
jgi:hypothetical protein